ncbi:MAG: AAA family ATPase [Myxococcales bacterium]|nr:AAA family ATPase [Myxococcales bacterium]
MRSADPAPLSRYAERVAMARGGAAVVSRAVDARSGLVVAIKRCVELEGARADAVAREGALLSVLSHPALAEYVEHGLDDGFAYVVTRWIEGESLEARAARDELSAVELVALARRIASALVALHSAGFAHGDITLSNVLLEGGLAGRAVLIDPSTHGFVTPEFAAPEVLRGALSNASSDLYSLGVLLRVCGVERSGRAALVNLARALQDERASRRPTATAVLAALDRIELAPSSAKLEAPRGESRSRLIATPLRGRERELAWLDAERARSDGGEAGIVVVRGPIGQGKSSLLRHWQNRRPFSERSLWANARGRGAPFALLESLLESALSTYVERDDPLLELASRSAQSPSERASLVALFAEVQRNPRAEALAPIVMVARSDPAMMISQLEWAFGRLLAAELARASLTVVLDDAHECDVTSSRVLSACLSRIRGPLLVIVAGRTTDERDPLVSMARASLALAPLDDAASALMTRDLWPSVDDAALRSILDRVEGNPLYIEQLALQQASDTAPVAEVIRRRVESRLPIERSVLAVAALLGTNFSATAARAVCADIASAGAIELAIEQLSNAGFLRHTEEGSLTFSSALVREAALDAARGSDERLQAKALRWLSAKGEDEFALALLADAAGERDVAALRYLGAARRATLGGDFGSATSYAERGLRCSNVDGVRAALDAVRAHSLGWQGRWREASESAARALVGVERGSEDWAHAASARCFALFELGELDASLRALDELLEVEPVERTFDALSWAYGAMAFALAASFADKATCARLVRASRSLAERAKTPRVAGAAARVRAEYFRAIEGDLGRAVESIVEAEALLTQAGDELGTIYTQGLHMRYRALAGDWQRALALGATAEASAERLGAASVRLYLRAARADVLLRARRVEDALTESLAVLESPGIASRSVIRAQSLRVVAEAYVELGDCDEAELHARAAVSASKSPCAERASALVVLSSVLLEKHALDAAVDAAREAVALIVAPRPTVTDDFGASAALALAFAASGRADEARRALEEARRSLDRWVAGAGPLRETMRRSSVVATRTLLASAAVSAL